MREMGRAARQGPLLHRLRHGVGQRDVEDLAMLEGRLELLVDVVGQELLLDGGREDVLAEWVVVLLGQVDGAKGLAVRAPAGGNDVLGAGLEHRRGSLLAGSAPPPGGPGGVFPKKKPGELL